jgi:hypothetical protein
MERAHVAFDEGEVLFLRLAIKNRAEKVRKIFNPENIQ